MKACFQKGLWQVIQTPPRITWQRVRGSGICLLAPVPHCLRFVRKGFNGPTISGSPFTLVELDARSCVGERESHSWPSRGQRYDPAQKRSHSYDWTLWLKSEGGQGDVMLSPSSTLQCFRSYQKENRHTNNKTNRPTNKQTKSIHHIPWNIPLIKVIPSCLSLRFCIPKLEKGDHRKTTSP